MQILEFSGHYVPWTLTTLLSIFVFSGLKQEFACNLLIALVTDAYINLGVKAVVRRQRPSHNEEDMFLTLSVDNYSFPSGHSSRAAMVAGLFAAFLVSEVWLPLIYCWAFCLTASRVILGRHHLSDVLSGVLIGLLECGAMCAVWIRIQHGKNCE